jgi:hypothetical protein
MPELPYDIEAIDFAFLKKKRLDGVREGRNLDFKVSLAFEQTNEKKELLADISAFANASGGDLLFGVDEDPDEPGLMGQIRGIKGQFDKIQLSIEQSLRMGVNPRIPGIRFHRIPIDDNAFVLLLRVPKSRVAPHMVTHSGDCRIYGRGAAGKAIISVQEIRDLVLSTESIEERLRRYRINRAAAVLSGELPTSMVEPPFAVFHLVPFESFTGEMQFSAEELMKASVGVLPPGKGGDGFRPVYEGVIHPSDRIHSNAYSMLSNQGIAEGVSNVAFGKTTSEFHFGTEQVPFVAEKNLLETAVRFFGSSQRAIETLGLAGSLLASIQLLNVKGHFLTTDLPMGRHPVAVSRDILDLGYVQIDSVLDKDGWANMLRPLFDRLANAAGHIRSGMWDEDGEINVVWSH